MAEVAEVIEDITFLNGAYADKMAASCNLVKAYKQGSTIVRFFDGAYINKTPDEIETQIKRITHACWECVEAARAAGKDV